MNWWKKMFKESVGGTEVRKKDESEDIKESRYGDVEVIEYSDSVYNDLEREDVSKVVESKVKVKTIKPLDLMKVEFEASPNKSNRKGAVEYIVLHHTGPNSFSHHVKWLCNKDAKASAHYVLGTNGQLKQLVSTKRESWHCGISRFCGEKLNNHRSIGIEICNIGRMDQDPEDGNYYYNKSRVVTKYKGKVVPEGSTIVYPNGEALSGFAVPYPEKQLDKLIALCKALVLKYPAITRDNILTHYEVAYPLGRKQDPFGLDVDYIKDMIFG